MGVALDVPEQIMSSSMGMRLNGLRNRIYTYLMFLTRFCGRGAWYFFLGSQTWLVIYDTKINRFLAIILTLFIVGVGVAACGNGFMLSRKLHAVRLGIKQAGQPVSQLSQQFMQMANIVGATPT